MNLSAGNIKRVGKSEKNERRFYIKKADLIEAMISLDEQEDQEKLSEQKKVRRSI